MEIPVLTQYPSRDFIVNGLAKASLEINGVYVPIRSIRYALKRFCTPVMLKNDDDINEVSIKGSCLWINIESHCFCIFSKHQLDDSGYGERNPEDIMLLTSQSNYSCGVSAREKLEVNVYGGKGKAFLEDIVLFYFNNKDYKYNIYQDFLSMKLNNLCALNDLSRYKMSVIFTIGYPSKDQTPDIINDECSGDLIQDITLRNDVLVLKRDKRNIWDNEYRYPLILDRKSTPDFPEPDGLSGAPVFAIVSDGKNYSDLLLCGMLTNGSKIGRFNAIDGKNIKDILSRVLLEKRDNK